MGLAEFAKVRSGGPAIAISIAVALVASLTLHRPCCNLLGKAGFWPPGSAAGNGPNRADVWSWISRKSWPVAHAHLGACCAAVAAARIRRFPGAGELSRDG